MLLVVFFLLTKTQLTQRENNGDFVLGRRYIIEARLERTLIGWYSISNMNNVWICNLPEKVIKKYFISISKDRKLKLEKLNCCV